MTTPPSTPLTTTPVPTPVPTTDPTDSIIPPAPSVGDLATTVAEPVCAKDPGSWCERFYQWTDNDFLAQSADVIVAKSFTIAVTVLLALIARFLLHRAIHRLVEGAASSRVSRIISRRTRPQLGEGAAAPVSPRRAQRARTIGSVLRSASSFVVGAVAVAMILVGVRRGARARSSPRRASSGSRSASARRTSSATSSRACSCCWRTSTASATSSTWARPTAPSRPWACGSRRCATATGPSGTCRNGEILRVGNKSQGFAVAVADLLLAHNADIAQAAEIATRVAAEAVADPEVAEYVIEPPEVVGIEKVGPEGVTFRVTARTAPGQQFGVQRALITALTEAFDRAGLPRPLAFPTAAPPRRIQRQ